LQGIGWLECSSLDQRVFASHRSARFYQPILQTAMHLGTAETNELQGAGRENNVATFEIDTRATKIEVLVG